MKKNIVVLEDNKGTLISLETDDSESGNQSNKKIKEALKNATNGLKQILNTVAEESVKGKFPANEIEIVTGFKITANGDFIIANNSNEGNFQIRMTWNKK